MSNEDLWTDPTASTRIATVLFATSAVGASVWAASAFEPSSIAAAGTVAMLLLWTTLLAVGYRAG